MSGSPIKFTSRTFNTILNDINSDNELVDTPNWYKRLISGIGDCLSMWENATANQGFLRTAFTRQAVADLLELIDYQLGSPTTSSGTLLFYLNADTVIFPKSIALADLAARSTGTLVSSSRKFEARAGASVVSTSEGFTTDFATDNNLDVAREYMTGEKVRVSTDGTLPAPLAVSTDYYVIKISTTEIRLATTLAGAYSGTEITLTSNGAGNHTVALYSTQVTCYQQETADQVIIGESDGITEWQKFDLPDLSILEDTLTIEINSVTWTKVDTLVDSTGSDTDYLFRRNTDGSSYIMFGDGTYGAVPGNFDIYATYSKGGGIDSNISVVNRISVYAGSDTDVLGVSNPSTFTGGSDEENIESAKIVGPMLLKARDRFVTVDDGVAIVLAYGGVSRVIINKNVYGLLSCQVPIVPNGGGTPSSALKTAIQTELINKSILSSIDVRVVDPTYNTQTTVLTVKILSGFVWATVQSYVMLALRLIFSERGYEIQQDYDQNGIASAVSVINSEWSTSFGTSDHSVIIRILDNLSPTDFDKDFQESDVIGFLDSFVEGVDYVVWTSPAFPITNASDEMTTDNVLIGNVTQIP